MEVGAAYLTLLGVSIMLFVAALLRSALHKLKVPGIVGDILAGMALSPYAVGGLLNGLLGIQLFQINDYVRFLADFSVVIIIFAAGLEHGISPLRSAGLLGALGATFGALLPLLGGYYAYAGILGRDTSLFMGLSMAATSLAAAAAIILERGMAGRGPGFLTAAAAIDDVVTFILLSVVMGLATAGSLSFPALARIIVYYSVAWVVIFAISMILVSRISRAIKEEYAYEFSLLVIFGLTALMTALGFSPIIAAFIAGVAIAEGLSVERVRRLTDALLNILGPIFFVVVGAESDLSNVSIKGLLLALELTGIAVAFKIVGVFPFALAYLRDAKAAAAVALGMTPRGETGLAIASIGLGLGVLNRADFTAIVLMALFTTIIGSIAFARTASWLEDRPRRMRATPRG